MTLLPALKTHARRFGVRRIQAAMLALSLCACAQSPTNFSQYPGFAEFYSANPRRTNAADLDEQALLTRFRPRFMLPPDHAGMIDFYADYVAQGTLYAADGTAISSQVTRALLNAHKNDPGVTFVHRFDRSNRSTPVVYGRVDRAPMSLAEGTHLDLVLLTYHAAFRHSGLPAGVGGWRSALLGRIANLDDWHQLDHYTAVTLVLDASERPLALMLQQHNYVRTYPLGVETKLDSDARPRIDVAIRSNELYPHRAGRTARRAVRFITPEAMRYLMGFGDAPRFSGDDITEGRDEADYTLAFLPPDDAFYSFAGFLGERRRLPGRDGPPGADFNVWPDLKAWRAQLVAGFFREGHEGDRARFEASYARTGNVLDFVRMQAPVLGAEFAQ